MNEYVCQVFKMVGVQLHYVLTEKLFSYGFYSILQRAQDDLVLQSHCLCHN